VSMHSLHLYQSAILFRAYHTSLFILLICQSKSRHCHQSLPSIHMTIIASHKIGINYQFWQTILYSFFNQGKNWHSFQSLSYIHVFFFLQGKKIDMYLTSSPPLILIFDKTKILIERNDKKESRNVTSPNIVLCKDSQHKASMKF